MPCWHCWDFFTFNRYFYILFWDDIFYSLYVRFPKLPVKNNALQIVQFIVIQTIIQVFIEDSENQS